MAEAVAKVLAGGKHKVTISQVEREAERKLAETQHQPVPLPTVGRVVHYWAKYASVPWAAIIAAIEPESGGGLTLHVLSPSAAFIAKGVHHSDSPQGSGTHVWSWPERVEVARHQPPPLPPPEDVGGLVKRGI